MASGSSSGRVNSGGSKGFEFASDEVLYSFENYANHDSSNGGHSDPVIGASSNTKDFHKTRMARSSVFPSAVHNPDSFGQDVISAVEKSMKIYADNLMRFLEGISSRLSQLELYCYNIDKSIGGMRHELSRDNGEADRKLKSLEKHIQEVHRSVQILRDKQELAETQKELAKLKLAKIDSSSSSHSQPFGERAPCSVSNLKKFDYESEVHSQQLALALPQQVAPQQHHLTLPPPREQAPHQNQQQSYNLPPTQVPAHTQTQHPQSQFLPDSQYHIPQLQDTARVEPPPTRSHINQTPSAHYQQQWPQQFTQQAPPLPATIQQPSVQPRMRPPPTPVYLPYASNQPANAPHSDTHPRSITMSMPYPGVPQPSSSQVNALPYGYTGAGTPVEQPQPRPPPQQVKENFRRQQGDGYMSTGPHPALPPQSTYMMYVSEAARTRPSQPPNYQGGYPPENAPLPNMAATSGSRLMSRNPRSSQFICSHPYNELIDKLISMGFRGDHIASVIQRMEEDGQPVDFNSVLDRLNAGPQREW